MEDNIFHPRTRKPIHRQGAEKYLELTLLSFAASVSITRYFLEMTGYPKIGSGDLHIAHVLWGGLLLFIACLVMLIFANRWVYILGSVLTGVGVGLFIDEVGKFITSNNDYFYPSAAPIIYAFFLMTVLVYFVFKKIFRKRQDSRTILYHVFEDMGEVLDHDLSPIEQEIIIERLDTVINQPGHKDIDELALSIKKYVSNEELALVEEVPGFLKKFYLSCLKFEEKWITRMRLKMIILVGMTMLGVSMIFYTVLFFSMIQNPNEISRILARLINNHLVNDMAGLTWYQTRICLEGSVGLILLISVFMIIFKREKQGILLGYLAIIFSLTIVNLIIFYFNQFSALSNTIIQFLVLLLIIRFRNRFTKI